MGEKKPGKIPGTFLLQKFFSQSLLSFTDRDCERAYLLCHFLVEKHYSVVIGKPDGLAVRALDQILGVAV
jgi:hypothetical protein